MSSRTIILPKRNSKKEYMTFSKEDMFRKGTLGIKWTEPIFKNSGKSKCAVLIPVYKGIDELSKFEEESIGNTVKVLGGKYEIFLVCGSLFDTDSYSKHFEYDFSYCKCNDKYFESQKSYSDLCEKYELYEAFSQYDYILICQPDAWIFEDRLEYFIGLGYDYIGCIHMLRSNGTGGRVGNGGFSLRKVSKFIEVCKKTDFEKFRFRLYEDCVFTISLKNEFNIPSNDIGFDFGWQEQPRAAMKITGKLPMACHSPMKNNWEFWRQYITIADDESNKRKIEVISGAENVSAGHRYNIPGTIKKKPSITRPI